MSKRLRPELASPGDRQTPSVCDVDGQLDKIMLKIEEVWRMAQLFRPHGHFTVWLEGQILMSDVTGPWNRESVELWAQHAFAAIATLGKKQNYVSITIIRESMLCPADAMAKLEQVHQYSQQKLRCLGNAMVVAPQVDGRNLVEAMYARIGLVDVFDELPQAQEWARALLNGGQ